MNKKSFYSELKSYFSIFIYFIFLTLMFGNNMTFATTCDQIDERTTLDHCREDKFSVQKIDKDGNALIERDNIEFSNFNPYKNPEYFYDKRNKYCWIWGAAVTAAYTTASIAATLACHTPDPVQETKDSSKIEKLRKVLDTIKKVKEKIGKVKKYTVKTLTGVGISLTTDPIIALQGELILDSIGIAWKITENSVQCFSHSNPAACPLIAVCTAAEIALAAALETAIFVSTRVLYDLAENNINKVKVCGYDWENYVYTQHDIEEYDCDSKNLEECKNYKKLYPQKGKFSNSYSYKLEKCFKYGEEKAKSDYGVDCSEVIKDYCDLKEGGCNGISITSKNIKNRLYREMLYRGKEFKISTKYNNDDDENICIDPRPDSQKGYSGSEQRYYFRGAEGAQYACNRFKYQNQGCVLDGKQIEFGDKDATKCQQAFESAYNCCVNRATLGICLYNVEDKDYYGRETKYNTMCLNSFDDDREECEVKTSATSNPKFVVIDNDNNYGKICVQNTNFCPYSYNLYGGTSVKDEFCDGDYSCSYSTCETKYSGDDTAIANCITKMSAEQDIVWSREHGKKVPTSAYGQPKNFLSYNAHCVDIGDMGKDPFQDMPDNKYLPKVCSDFVGDSRNLPVPFAPVDLDSPVGQYLIAGVDFDLGQYRGFTAPMVQCFKETLSNMFHNKVGMSVCKNPYEVINGEGLCGTDTFYCLCPPSDESNNSQSLDDSVKKCDKNLPQCKNNEGKYVINRDQIDRDKYLRVIGDDLSVNENIFYKLQSRLQLIIKLFAILAIIIIGIQFLLKGDLNIFDDVKKPKAMIVGMMKFAIVFYFAVGNAWQTNFYKWIDNFVSDLYQKVFELSLLNYSPIKNTAREIVCTRREYAIKDCPNQEFFENGIFVIPDNVDYLELEVYGANGGSNGTNKFAKGGYTFGKLELSSTSHIKKGNVLYVNIGKSGGSTNKGGGATDIRTSNSKELTCDSDDPRIIVAGGGGGAGNSYGDYDLTKNGCTGCGEKISAGGAGKAGAGNDGSSYDQNAYGKGATSTAGGAGGTHKDGLGSYTAESGVCGFGGKGIGRTDNLYYGDGGDGWYGGGGASGGHAGGSGGGGSGYAASYLTEISGTQGGNNKDNNGNGYAKITAYRDNSKISPELSSSACFSLKNTTENYFVEDSTIMEDQTLIEKHNNRCFLTESSRICYENCQSVVKKDSSDRQEYVWDEKYDGCYFGNTKYPEGKKYLSIFDTLDCKLMNYFNYTPDIDLPGIIHFAVLSMIWSPLAVSAVLLSSIFFVILLLIVIKIFYMFLMSFFMINILIYISPIVFPSLLFKNYKNMFDTWLKKLMGYSLQLVFIIVFSGLFIINLEKIGLGDAKYINHDPLTGRLPVIDCNSVVGADSLICLFNISTSKGETPLLGTSVKKILGLGPIIGVAQSLNQDFVGTVITLLKACLILYVLLQFMKGIDKIIFEITGTGAFNDGTKSFKEIMTNLKGKLETGARIARYSGKTGIRGAKSGAKFVGDKITTLRDLSKSGDNNKNSKDDKGGKTGKSDTSNGSSDSNGAGTILKDTSGSEAGVSDEDISDS